MRSNIRALLWLGWLASIGRAFVGTSFHRDHRHSCFELNDKADIETEIPVLLNADAEEETPFMLVQPEINGYSMPSGKGYSASLERQKPSWLSTLMPKRSVYDGEMDEDGYEALQRPKDKLLQIARLPWSVARKAVKRSTTEPGTLILVRHGESEWNRNKTFTGWADPDLTEQGKREVEHAARLLMEGGYKIDVVFTSRLKRAIRSVWILLQEFNEVYLPVFKSWRLNERMVRVLRSSFWF